MAAPGSCISGVRAAVCSLLAGLALVAAPAFANPSGRPAVREIPIDGAIGPALADYVVGELKAAAKAGAPLVILRLDTPGGLSTSMRDIIKAVLGSKIPVIGFVGPSGARAASAGTYILYATNIAAMAPATNVGAATPVNLAGGGGDHKKNDGKKKNNAPTDSASAERRKVVNDAVAYIRGLAQKRHRNADWAEKAVRQAASISAKTALAKHVIEYIAPNAQALLADIDGVKVTTASGRKTLHTKGLTVKTRTPGWRTRLLAIITNPTVAYLLFLAGIVGLVLEGFNPGATLPGVIGGICLLCALYAFHVLPVNYTGLGLILLGIALIIAEGFAPSFGALGFGGVVAFVFGSIMLIDTAAPGFQVSLAVIGGIGLGAALLLLLIVVMFLRSRRERVHTGHAGLIGAECVALADFNGQGRVRLHGESWLAESQAPVRRGQRLRVTDAQGLKVFVSVDDPRADRSSFKGQA